MSELKPTMAEQLAKVASHFQFQRTGHAPKAVTVVFSGETLVISLHGALTPAEQALSCDPLGAAKVQEFHRQLFANSAAALREEIKRITGVDVREAVAEVETTTGTVVHAFTSGTMVQVFQMAGEISAEGTGPAQVPSAERPGSWIERDAMTSQLPTCGGIENQP